MESNNKYKPSSEAFSRYFAGENDQDELTQIQNWARDSEANQEELELLSTIWSDVGVINEQPVIVDTATAFAKVKAKKEAHHQSSSSFWNVWKVAAAVILAASAFLMIIREDNDVRLVAETIDEVELSDGTKITVNEGSTLVYRKEFKGTTRNISLSGEAFFEVAHKPEQPFVVKVQDVTITVLGTSFNIKESAESVNVSVATGRVEVKSEFGIEVLTAGEQVSVNLSKEELTKSENSESGTEQYWFSRKLSFQGVDMATVIKDLEEAYDVDIAVSDQNMLECKLQATFESQSIDEILEIIGLSQSFEVEKSDGAYLLIGEGCDNL